MLGIIVNSFVLGSLLSLFIGPVFFLLIQASIKDGYKGGLPILLGLYLSDLIYVFLTFSFFEFLVSLEIPERDIKIVGAIVFIIIGFFYMIKKEPKLIKKKRNNKVGALKSFIINTINPSVFFFWFAAISWGKEKFDNIDLIIYLLLGLCIAFFIDCLKIFFAIKIAALFNSNKELNFNFVIGLVVFVIGLTLTYQNIIV